MATEQQKQQAQQSGSSSGKLNKTQVQSMITQIESSPQANFNCTADQAQNVLLPALKDTLQHL